MSIIRYSVRNPLIVNIVMIAVVILGLISQFRMPRELMPKVSFNWSFIIVPFPGVGAEEVEKLLTIPIEDEIADIENIKTISTESNEGGAFLWVQFEDISDATFTDRSREIESRVNELELPVGTLDPVIDEFDSDDFIPVISVSIAGEIPERTLHRLTEDMRDDLQDIKGVGQVAVTGTREREIWIEVNQQKLYQYGLSLSQVSQAIASKHLNLSAGDLTIGNESYLIRTIGEVDKPDDFRKIVVRWDPSGNHLYLGELAKVSNTWAEEASRSRIDNQPSATISISKKASANSLEVIDQVKEIARQYQSRLPSNSKIVFTNDNSIYILDILNKLWSNAILGFVLVIIILYVFMGFRNAIVVAIGIPVSFLTTFIFMERTGQTFNGNSLFGLILVLGIVVDDAIIVIENCFRYLQSGMNRKDAAIKGTTEVFAPVISATLTTIAAFLPLILMTGIMGKFMRIIPIIISLTLVASLLEVFFIAPSHFAEWGGRRGHGGDSGMKRLKKIYTRILLWVIRRRYAVGPAVLLLVLIFAMLIPVVGMELFRGDEISQFMVWVTMPIGSRLEDTDQVIKRIERITRDFPEGELHAVIGNAGILQSETDWIYADHVGQVIIDLVEKEYRNRDIQTIMNEVRAKIKEIEGPLNVRVAEVHDGPPVGKPVEVKVKGKYLDELSIVSDEVKQVLEKLPGVYDVGDDFYPGKNEIQLVVNEAKASMYGLNAAIIAQEVRTAINGFEATVFREGDEEIDVRVKLAGAAEGGIEQLKSLTILSPIGSPVKLNQICKFETKKTLFRIRRFERERAITVTANIDRNKTSPVKVNMELEKRFEDIGRRNPGYRLDFRGEMEEFKEAFTELGELFLFGVILIFIILTAQFKSLSQPFVILLTIPFGFIGSMVGLLVIAQPFSITTMYGMVALAGIAVNDAIVMLSFINDARAHGIGKWRSIIQSGRLRLRPIILTSVTTILGLLPMAIGLGGKSESWGPFANTIAWGLAAATILTLLAIPAMYSIAVDDMFGIKRLKRK